MSQQIDAPNAADPIEVEHLLADNEALRARLAKAEPLATVGVMSSMVIHEFNNIFNTLMNRAYLAEQTGSEPLRTRAIRSAIESSSRAGAICEALLGLVRPGRQARRRVRLADLVDQTLAAMARPPEKDGIRLIKTVPADLKVEVRPAELQHVLLNLLLNAIDAVQAAGGVKRIRISAHKVRGAVHLRVQDTGVGIARDDLERIFEPFFTTKAGRGTGLGLAVCQRMVESIGGALQVRSQPGKGSCFTVSFVNRAERAASSPAGRGVRGRRRAGGGTSERLTAGKSVAAGS